MTPTFFAVKNLTDQAVISCEPWNFQPSEKISEQVRHSKKDRQEWYRSTSTAHQFYTAVEGVNPNQRASKNNPPHRIHAIVADYDLPLDAARILEAVNKMKIKPSWTERSLGGNCRLVWVLSRPLMVDSYDFAVFILQQAKEWLQLELLPGLDAPALEDPTRLYCNGCEWTLLSNTPLCRADWPTVDENLVQGFFVECGQKFNFKDCGSDVEIPLDLVEKKLVEKFPSFSWPGPFEANTQGPSFWVAGSTSPMSAILKKFGMFTFSAHASKSFFSWADLLGAEFAKEFQTNAVATATTDKFWDGKSYWGLNSVEGRFVSMSREVLITHLKVCCRVSTKADKLGSSLMDRCLEHIHTYGRVEGGAPLIFLPPGLTMFNNTKLINTAPRSMLIQPSGVPSTWGSAGNFALISDVLDGIFDPAKPQLDYFLAWLQYFYKTALNQTPAPGQNIFLAGAAGIGKTLLNREIVGALMGGYVDAARFMLGDVAFNSSLFTAGVWSVDDSTVSDSESARKKFSSYIKLAASNSSFEMRKKFENSLMIPWQGRIFSTLNLDAASSRSLPILDESTIEKVSFFRCALAPKVVFPPREEIKKSLKAELPNFAQWLVDWQTPAELIGSARYGVKSYHAPELLDKSHQAGRSAPFREVLLEFLNRYFEDNPKAVEWRGSCTQLMRCLHADPLNEPVLRAIKIESINRYCEDLSREAVLNCHSVSGDRRTRIWVFERT